MSQKIKFDHVQRSKSFFALLTALLVLVNGAVNALATDGSWILEGSSGWSTAGNWQNSQIADGAGATAWFTNEITQTRTVTVDAPRTLGTLNIGYNNQAFAFNSPGGNALTFDNSGGFAYLNNINKSDHTAISVPILLKSSLVISNGTTATSARNDFKIYSNITANVSGSLMISNVSPKGYLLIGGDVADGGGGTLGIVHSCPTDSTTTLYLFGGPKTYSGNTVINAGTLALTNGASISNTASIRIAAGATFDVSRVSGITISPNTSQTLSCSSASGIATITALVPPGTRYGVTFNSGTAFSFQADGSSATNGKISVTGYVTNYASSVTVNVQNAPLPAGSYQLISSAYALTNFGTFGTPVITGQGLASGCTSYISVRNGNSGHIDLVVTNVGSQGSLSWNTGNGTWNTTTANWVNTSSLLSSSYSDGLYAVIFGDASGASGNPAITLNSTYSPTGVSMNSTSHDYSIIGTGGIGGSTALTLNPANTKTLTIATTNNTYTGGTTVGGGKLCFFGSAAEPASGSLAISNGATAILASPNVSESWPTVAVTGAGRLEVTNANGWRGYNELKYDMSGFTGVLDVTGSGCQAALIEPFVSPAASATIRVQNGTTFYLGYQGENVSCNVELYGATDMGEGYGVLRLENDDIQSGPVILKANSSIGGGENNDGYISGVIRDDGAGYGFAKVNYGTIILQAANTYSGNTTINGGTLLVNNTTGSGTGTGKVIVNSGATLGGAGTISGAVTNLAGGTLLPGTNEIGTLTVNGNLTLAAGSTNTFAVNGSIPANTRVALGGTVTYDGVLYIVPSGSFTTGQAFTLFSGAGATRTGNFASLQLSTNISGVVFSFTNGVLRVVSGGGTPTPIINATATSLSGFSTITNVASSPQSFTVSGTNLTANITNTAPTGYEVSINGGASYGSTAIFTQSGGTAGGTLHVRLAATSTAGSYSGNNIELTSAGAATVNVYVSGTVTNGVVASTALTITSMTISGNDVILSANNVTSFYVIVSTTNLSIPFTINRSSPYICSWDKHVGSWSVEDNLWGRAPVGGTFTNTITNVVDGANMHNRFFMIYQYY